MVRKSSIGELAAIFDKLSSKDQIPGGLADKKDNKDFDPKQLAKGKKVEMEHTDDPKKAEEIARDHLMEDSKYYDKLAKMEGDNHDDDDGEFE